MSSKSKKEKKKNKKDKDNEAQEELESVSIEEGENIIEVHAKMASIDENEKKIDELYHLMQDYMNKDHYEDAIIIANSIVEIFKKTGKKQKIQETEKSISLMQKELKNKYKNIDIDEKIEIFQKQKQKFDEKEEFEEAIRVSKKIIEVARIIGKKKLNQEEVQFIEAMEEKIKNRPTKVEIIDKIERLKGVKKEHTVKQEYDEAIEISKEIIKFANMAGVKKVIEEEENSIKSIQKIIDKEQYILDGIKEYKKMKEDYDILVKYNAIKQAHSLMEKFYEKFADTPQVLADPEIEKDYVEDKKQWVAFQVEKDKVEKDKLEKEGTALARQKIVKLEMEKVKLEEEKSRIRREVTKLKRQQLYSETGKAKAEIEKKASQIEIEKKRLELERKKFEDNKVQWEIEKENLKSEKEQELEKNTLIEVEKTEINEAREKLSIDITRFMEEKEEFNTEKLDLEEQMAKKEEVLKKKEIELEEAREKLEWEKLKFQQEKEKFDEDKKKFQEIKKKISEL